MSFIRRPHPAKDPGEEDAEIELAELLAEVRRIDVMSTRLVTSLLAGGYSSAFPGAGMEFEGVREYAEGDDLRSVDWNVTARMGRPFVKTWVAERELTVLFLLDLSPSMQGGFARGSVRQSAARVCGCLALSAIRNGDKVGLVAFGETVERYVPPGKGAGHALRIVRDCLALPTSGKRTDFAPALDLVSGVLRKRAIVFLLSDFFSEGWLPALSSCARRHDVVAVRLLTPEVRAGVAPGRELGLVRLSDPESGRGFVADFRCRRVRDAWSARVAAWRERTEEDLGRAGVDRIDVAVPRERDPDAIARPILEFFRMRERRSAKR